MTPPPRLTIFILLALAFSASFASDSTQTWAKLTKKWETISIKSRLINPETEKSLVKSVEVLDVRSDTDRCGIFTNWVYDVRELVTEVPLQVIIKNSLSNDTSGIDLLVVVKDFWISEIKNYSGNPGFKDSSRSGLKLKSSMDVFFNQEGSYIPLTRLDSTIVYEKQALSPSAKMTEIALVSLNKKITDALNAKKYLTRKARSKELVVSEYSKRFHMPVMTDDTFKKGIYYTWEQFKSNRPVEDNFTIQQNKKAPPSLFRKDEKGNEILQRNVFAVSDGSQLYKVQEGFVFPMYRNKNALYWMGLEKYDLRTKGAPVAAPLGGGSYGYALVPVTTTMKIRLTPYLLNLEKGEEY